MNLLSADVTLASYEQDDIKHSTCQHIAVYGSASMDPDEPVQAEVVISLDLNKTDVWVTLTPGQSVALRAALVEAERVATRAARIERQERGL